jgi:hypothetical protein
MSHLQLSSILWEISDSAHTENTTIRTACANICASAHRDQVNQFSEGFLSPFKHRRCENGPSNRQSPQGFKGGDIPYALLASAERRENRYTRIDSAASYFSQKSGASTPYRDPTKILVLYPTICETLQTPGR